MEPQWTSVTTISIQPSVQKYWLNHFSLSYKKDVYFNI